MNIFDIKRFAVHDGPGIRTTVFFKGCPLSCSWCHNPESQSPDSLIVEEERAVNGHLLPGKRIYGEERSVEELMELLLRDMAYYESSEGGVTFSGGEPLMQPEALAGLLKASKAAGMHTCVDTCGHAPWKVLENIMADTDLFLYDLKHMDPRQHKKYTGVSNELVLSNATHLLDEGAEVEFRIPVIPGINTSERELGAMLDFISGLSHAPRALHLLPYHKTAEHKYRKLKISDRLRDVKEPSEEEMQEIRARFMGLGPEVSIGG